MAKRKALLEGDSLELLLDTMCNTFGGVMFIAIALVVMSSFIPDTVKEIEEDEAIENMVEQLQRKITQSSSTLATLKDKRSIKNRIIENFDDGLIRKHMVQLADINKEIEKRTIDNRQAKATVVKAKFDNKRLTAKRQDAETTYDDVKNQLDALRGKIKTTDKDIADAVKIMKGIGAHSPQPMRRPLEGGKTLKTTRKKPFALVMKDKRIFLVSKKGTDSLYDGRSLVHSDDVDLNLLRLRNTLGLQILPKSGKGSVVGDKAKDKVLFSKLFHGVSERDRFVFMLVKKDSFAEFIRLKTFLRRNGYSMYWYPVEKDSEFVLQFSDKENVAY